MKKITTILLSFMIAVNCFSQLTVTIVKDTVLPLKQSISTNLTLTTNVTWGTPTTYSWTKISGPTSPTINNSTTSSATIVGFSEGTYVYRCTVNGTAFDNVTITVRDWQKTYQRPCRVGAPQTFTLSATSTTDFIHPYVIRSSGISPLGGDTIKINPNPNNGGKYNYFYLGGFGGSPGCPVIVVPNGAPIKIAGANRLHLGKNLGATADTCFLNNVVLDGTYLRSRTGDYFGFQNTGTSWGISAEYIADVDLKGFSFIGNSLGIQIKTYSDSLHPWTVWDNFKTKNIRLHDCYFRGISGSEGTYLGTTDLSGSNLNGNSGNDGPTVRGDSLFVYSCFIDTTGWDGLQTSAFWYTEIYNNVILNTSRKNQSSQNAGLIVGAATRGRVHHNIIYNGTSATMQIFGFGNVEVDSNFVYKTTGNGIYADQKNTNIIEATTYPSLWGGLKMNIHHNLVGKVGTGSVDRAIKNQNNEHTTLKGAIRNNFFVDSTRSASGLVYTAASDTVANNTVYQTFNVTITNVTQSNSAPKFRVAQGNYVDTFTSAKDAITILLERIQGDSLSLNTYYQDFDGDGFGNLSVTTSASSQPAGYVSNSTDCDDTDDTVYPNAPEVCDGQDNDCDGQTDEGIKITYYQDFDSDGYGNASVSVQACSPPAGYVTNNTDCNDTNGSIVTCTTTKKISWWKRFLRL